MKHKSFSFGQSLGQQKRQQKQYYAKPTRVWSHKPAHVAAPNLLMQPTKLALAAALCLIKERHIVQIGRKISIKYQHKNE